MNNTERIHKIHQMLTNRKFITTEQFLRELQISVSTLKRDLSFLKDRLNAPLKYDHDLGGYCFDSISPVGPKYEVPGLWFNDSELHALLSMQKLLNDVQPGLITPYLQPLQSRLQAILCSMKDSPEEISNRILILAPDKRELPLKNFEMVATATIRRHRLKIVHFNRGTNTETERIVSPQQLVYYRDNWYVDCWCHTRKAIRSFSIDAIISVELLSDQAKNISIKKLREELSEGYGIFSGKAVQWAKLRVTNSAVRWVSKRVWHTNQKSSFETDESLLLEIPYTDDRELMQDILAWLPDVEVFAPKSLRMKLSAILKTSLEKNAI
jgi:predicted DNA-binding transcriptional regulator YafY